MIWLARLALRLAGRAGLRWIVAAAAGRFVLRRLSRGAVDRAAAELESKANDRLPESMARAVGSLPPAVLTAGGTALVASRSARSAFNGGRRVRRVTRDRQQMVAGRVASARSVMDQVRTETDAATRQLRARYLGASQGPGAGIDAQVDRAGPTRSLLDEVGLDGSDPHDEVAPAVRPGRRRGRRSPRPEPDRARRSYRPAPKPWD